MKISSIKYLLPVLLLISLTGCMGSFTCLDHQNDSMNGGSAPLGTIAFLDQTIPESRIKTLYNHIFKFVKMNGMAMAGLLALCSMWLLARAYKEEKQRHERKYEELGLLKIARNILEEILKKYWRQEILASGLHS